MPPKNRAIILSGAKQPLTIQKTPYTRPGPHELVIKSRAIAINAADAYKELLGDAFLPYIKLRCVPGNDLAGEVVEVGSAITRFHAGDRVCAEAAGTPNFGNCQVEGAFQEYVVVAGAPDSVNSRRCHV
jgi:NADPH:quinone reductase-like Zn-dependent oxidoreductase